jgi:hypothetical protein
MNPFRQAAFTLLCSLVAATGCSKPLPEEGSLQATSKSMTVTGEYRKASLEAVERMTIENGKLVLHGTPGSATVDLPPGADPDQKNRGWALVTEGETDGVRTLTFTHETTLDDFTVTVPPSEGQVAYGSLGGRDGGDVILFAYGSGSKTYWGWAAVGKK